MVPSSLREQSSKMHLPCLPPWEKVGFDSLVSAVAQIADRDRCSAPASVLLRLLLPDSAAANSCFGDPGLAPANAHSVWSRIRGIMVSMNAKRSARCQWQMSQQKQQLESNAPKQRPRQAFSLPPPSAVPASASRRHTLQISTSWSTAREGR